MDAMNDRSTHLYQELAHRLSDAIHAGSVKAGGSSPPSTA
jgi:hypothetical protein